MYERHGIAVHAHASPSFAETGGVAVSLHAVTASDNFFVFPNPFLINASF
jgi:hypothetical protein